LIYHKTNTVKEIRLMELQLATNCNLRSPRIRGKFMLADNNKAILDFKCIVPEPVQYLSITEMV